MLVLSDLEFEILLDKQSNFLNVRQKHLMKTMRSTLCMAQTLHQVRHENKIALYKVSQAYLFKP